MWVKIRVFFPRQNSLFYALFSTFERKHGTLIMTHTILETIKTCRYLVDEHFMEPAHDPAAHLGLLRVHLNAVRGHGGAVHIQQRQLHRSGQGHTHIAGRPILQHFLVLTEQCSSWNSLHIYRYTYIHTYILK